MKRYKFIKKNRIRKLKIKSFTEGIKLNSPFKLPEDRTFYNFQGARLRLQEKISYEFDESGGIIVFSTDVNAMVDKKGFLNKIKGIFKGKIQTLINRFKKYSKLDTTLSSFGDVQAYSVGNFFKGKYFDRETGKTYTEKSLSVEIIGIDSKLLVTIAEEIAKGFNQKEVLVKDYNTNKIFLVDTL